MVEDEDQGQEGSTDIVEEALNTDSDVYYGIYTKTTLNDMVTGTRPRASLKEMLDTSRILDAMNAKAGK